MVLAQKTMVTQLNAEINALNVLLSGAAYAALYTLDAGTADADPGPGLMRIASTPQNAATTLRFDLSAFGGLDQTEMFSQMAASTNPVKGSVRLTKRGDITKWLRYDVTAVATPTGYRNLTVTPTGGSEPSPFAAGDDVFVMFSRAGDRGLKGDSGSGAFHYLGGATISSAVAAINYLSIMADDYESYTIELAGLTVSTGAELLFRAAVNGTVLSGASDYTVLGGTSGNVLQSTNTRSEVSISATGLASSGTGVGNTLTIEIRNARSTKRKEVRVRGFIYSGGSDHYTVNGTALVINAGVLSGFSIFPSTGNITGGTIRIFGRRHT